MSMKRFALIVCCLMAAMVVAVKSAPTQKKSTMKDTNINMMVISDIHLLAPELHDAGVAAQHLASSDMKLVLQSDQIMSQMADEIIAQKPQMLLITGDLTFNGERASHERLIYHLQKLVKAGIKVLVIPGNHDINNPNARSYKGVKPQDTSTINREEFAALYRDFGYGEGSDRDPNSLSYVCEPVSGLMLLCLDTNRDEENRLKLRGDSVNSYHNDGRLKESTMKWMSRQLEQARTSGKRVVALMHHHLVEHIDGEALVLSNYIVSNHEQVAEALVKGGVKVVFTGHLHITDAATMGGITDVATGSASTYPLPMRAVTIDGSLSSMNINTRFFDKLDSQLLEQGRRQVERSVDGIAAMISGKLWQRVEKMKGSRDMFATLGIDESKMPQSAQQLSVLVLKHLREPLTQSLLLVSHGGEDPSQGAAIIDAVRLGVRGMLDEVMPGQDEIAEFLMDNLMPRVETVLRSALEDINKVDTDEQSSTPDLSLALPL